ncbi:hypothetical protein PtB15_16B68 [Puccinia triticina]|nr:hypothetical protein PtB15_16B68 [Puccinia triticina]
MGKGRPPAARYRAQTEAYTANLTLNSWLLGESLDQNEAAGKVFAACYAAPGLSADLTRPSSPGAGPSPPRSPHCQHPILLPPTVDHTIHKQITSPRRTASAKNACPASRMLPWNPTRELAAQTQNYLHALGGGNAATNEHQQPINNYNNQFNHPLYTNNNPAQQPFQPNIGPPPPIQNPTGNITLPQVLHYLQSTHRTHLSLQNSWEIERAELRARVALLEGEKRSWEQAKTDLARRVRMLEWALKMERSKYLSHNQNKENTNAFTMALPAGKLAALRMAENGGGPASGSESPARADSPKYDEQNAASSAARPTGPTVMVSDTTNQEQSPPPNPPTNLPVQASAAPAHSISIAPPLPAVAAQNMVRMGTNGNVNTWANGMTGAGMATMMGGTGIGFGTTAMGLGRDPKARARSRDYLKQCMQEVNYLTSNQVLNPLPQQSALIPGIERPRKILNETQAAAQGGPNQANVHQPGNNQQVNSSPNPIHRPLNHPGGPQDQSQRSALYQVSTIDNQHQPNVSSFSQHPGAAPQGSNVHPTTSAVPGAPVMTRARSSSRPLLITPMSTDAATGSGIPAHLATTPSHPLTVANLPLLSSADQSMVGSDSAGSAGSREDESPNNKMHNGIVSNLGPNGISSVNHSDPPEISATEQQTMFNRAGGGDGRLSPLVMHGRSSDGGDGSNDGAEDGNVSVFDDADESRLTAIYRPESSESWKEQLRLAGEKEKMRMSRKEHDRVPSKAGPPLTLDHQPIKPDEELAGLTLHDHPVPANNQLGSSSATNPSGTAPDGKNSSNAGSVVQKGFDGYKVWKPKRTLRSHLDAARCIAFDRYGLAIVSGSDDCTVKLWRLNPASIANPSPSSWPETEPQITYRGHSATITSVAISSSPPRIYSASLDSVVSVWSLPPAEHETYAPYDPRSLLASFVGHTDAIWDMVLLPLRLRDEALLATVSADGTVKVWSTDELNSPLKLSWGYDGLLDDDPSPHQASNPTEQTIIGANGISVKVTPTSVAVVWSDLKKVAVSYTNSVIKLFELENGKVSLRLKSDETFDGTTATQINKIVTHPTLPLLISAHEDRFIRLYDLNTGACTHSMLGHLDSVTSLSIDPTGLILVSGGHDCSIRFWDLTGSRTCLQEISSHRYKSNQEGVLDVNSGADGTIKIFG